MNATFVICFAVCATALAQIDRTAAVKPGRSLADASEILSTAGLKGEERHFSMALPEDCEHRYFPVADNVALTVGYTRSTGEITSLSLMTTPAHNPVKGLQVHIPLLSIQFAADGSYAAQIAKPAPKDAGTASGKK